MFAARSLSLALLMLMPLAVNAQAARVVAVNFPDKKLEAHYEGHIQGGAYDAYRFRGAAGKVLNAILLEERSSPDVDVSVRYLEDDNMDEYLLPFDQMLPVTGLYEIRVLQTRNGIRKNKQAKRPYALAIRLSDPLVEVVDIVIGEDGSIQTMPPPAKQ